MGQLIDFQEAKEKILGRSTQDEPVSIDAGLSLALEEFSFSRLSKEERIDRSLQQAFVNGGFQNKPIAFNEISLEMATILAPYLPDDVFHKPLPKAGAGV